MLHRLAGELTARRFPVAFEPRMRAMVDIYVDFALAHPRQFELMFLSARPGARQYPKDFKAGRYRAMAVHRVRAAADSDGRPTAFQQQIGAEIALQRDPRRHGDGGDGRSWDVLSPLQ